MWCIRRTAKACFQQNWEHFVFGRKLLAMVSDRRRFLTACGVWLGTFVCCALAIVRFYGLLHGHDVYPLGGNREQAIAAVRTGLIATFASSWAIWIGTSQRSRLTTALWRTGLATQISLTLFAIAGWQSPPSLDLIFPSTFFAEYNWLTFIFQVAPATAIAASFLLYLSYRQNQRIAKPSTIRD